MSLHVWGVETWRFEFFALFSICSPTLLYSRVEILQDIDKSSALLHRPI
jgi:hypothetical protein